MTTTSTSVKIHGGHNYEFGAIGNNVTPLDLLISKEELIREVEIENTYTPSQLGKWIVAPNSQLERWITTASSPATPSKLVNQLAQNVIEGAIKAHVNAGYKYREAVAKMQKGDPEKGEEPAQTPEELSATAYAAILRMQEIERWKTEQRKVRGAQRHHLREHTQKVDGKWQDAEVYELPPLVHHTGVGIKHKPAYYFLRLPDKRVVNLSKADGGYGKVLRESPDSAMQTIATRLGLRIKGGAATILQHLTGLDDIIPAYTTVWNNNEWFVIVGWMKNPSIKLSNYTEGDDEQLIYSKITTENHLTHSKLEYKLISAASIEAHDEELDQQNACLDFDEQIQQGLEGTDYRQEVDTDDFDASEFGLYMFLREHTDLSQFTAGSDDLNRPCVDELFDELYNDAWTAIRNVTPGDDAGYSLAQREIWKLNQLEATLIQLRADKSGYTGPFVSQWNMRGNKKLNALASLGWSGAVPNGHIEPLNAITPHHTHRDGIKADGVVVAMHRLQRGKIAIIPTGDQVLRKFIPEVKAQATHAGNASPRLVAVLKEIRRKELELEFA
jgi:hypothetical protein